MLQRMEEIKNEENKCGSGKHMSYALESPIKGGINSEAQSTTRTRSLASKDLEMEINNNYLEELAKVPWLIEIKSLIPDISIPRSDLDFSYQPKDISSAPAKKPQQKRCRSLCLHHSTFPIVPHVKSRKD